MFREINVAGFVLKNGWVFCQITFLIYMIILAVMDIKRRQVHLGFLLSGIIWVILSVICERRKAFLIRQEKNLWQEK